MRPEPYTEGHPEVKLVPDLYYYHPDHDDLESGHCSDAERGDEGGHSEDRSVSPTTVSSCDEPVSSGCGRSLLDARSGLLHSIKQLLFKRDDEGAQGPSEGGAMRPQEEDMPVPGDKMDEDTHGVSAHLPDPDMIAPSPLAKEIEKAFSSESWDEQPARTPKVPEVSSEELEKAYTETEERIRKALIELSHVP